MIEPICRKCHEKLKLFGGLLISPPTESLDPSVSQVIKSHLCTKCYKEVTDFINGKK